MFRFFAKMALFALLLLPASCTSKQNEPDGPPEKITFAYADFHMSALVIIAHLQGFFTAEGVDAVLQRHEYGKLALRSVLDGKADLATVGDTPLMFAVTSGEKVHVLSVISVAEKSEAIVARKDRGIMAPADLSGKTIGVSLGTTGDFFLEAFLASQGIQRTNVRIVDLPPQEMAAALAQGRVDAVSTWQPVVSRLRLELGGRGIIFHDETIYSEIMCVSARQDFTRSRPVAVRRVLKALVRSEGFIRDNPEEARRLVAGFIKLDKSILDDIWKIYDFRVTLGQALLVILEDQTKWAREVGRIDASVRPNYLDYIYSEGLQTVKPEAVRLIR